MPSESDFWEWCQEARHPSQYKYHSGFLLIDRAAHDATAAFKELQSAVVRAFAEGRVDLTQRRLGPMCYEYIATKRRRYRDWAKLDRKWAGRHTLDMGATDG
jgi:hypothetical protein